MILAVLEDINSLSTLSFPDNVQLGGNLSRDKTLLLGTGVRVDPELHPQDLLSDVLLI